MSAFIKRQPARTVDLGTRPGLNGQVLISTGVAGIDKLLGGGLPLGSLLLIIEDSLSQQHLNLLKCFLAEGICCKHSLALLTGQEVGADTLAASLPDQAKSSSSSSGGGSAGVMQVRRLGWERLDQHAFRLAVHIPMLPVRRTNDP